MSQDEAGDTVGARGGDGRRSAAREVVEVFLSWGEGASRTVLGVTHVAAGGHLALGESGDLLLPAAALGAEHAEIVRYDGDRAVALAPPGARLRLDGWERHASSGRATATRRPTGTCRPK